MRAFGLTQGFGLGAGFQQVVRGAAPAAGANFQVVGDSRYVQRLVSLVFTLTTDANGGNRYVTVEYQADDAAAFAVAGQPLLVAASKTQRYVFALHGGNSGGIAGSDIFAGLPGVFLHGGDTLNILVGGKQAGDTLTGIRLTFENFWETAPAD